MYLCVSVLPADVLQVLVIKEEVPHEWSPSMDQQDPELLQVKEEQEELWTSQEGEMVNGREETDITRFPFTAVPVKSEDDGDKDQSSQLYQSQHEENREVEPPNSGSAKQRITESDGADCGGPETVRDPVPNSHSQPSTEERSSDSLEIEVSEEDGEDDTEEEEDWQEPLSVSDPDSEDSDNKWKGTSAPESGANCDVGCDTEKKLFSCSECGKQFLYKGSLQKHMASHSGKSSSSCSIMEEKIDSQMRVQKGEKPFGCDVCGKRLKYQHNLKTHMTVHTGEKPFGCDVCGQRFSRNTYLETHMSVHTGEKPFSCNICEKRFRNQYYLNRHTSVHAGEKEKPFNCSVCGKRFMGKTSFKTHMRIHTGEKPFDCATAQAADATIKSSGCF
ncbi:gastrula zinc finger protein xFG20-1-like [Stegastes partitus]|uniref:Gastrula zinc finger protein xFG20-1-like n=1 Tax=Stegastes partitus TaxID=144197 RepID=A0A9Y4JZG1_9TELE|nr:PREDICTED: gastrula zinc finger protein xFG20-1-like [Stegastes partitus]